MEQLKLRINADALPLVVVALPLLAASLAGAGYEHGRNVWLVCVAIILCYAFFELKRCREAGIALRLSSSYLTGFVVIGCLLMISSVAAAWHAGRTQWHVPLGEIGFLFAQGFGTAVCVVARGLREPHALQRLERALHMAGVFVCLSVIVAYIGYAMFNWRLGEVLHPGFGIRSFGPLGDSVAWIIVPFLALWWLRGERVWCCLGGAALALTGSIGPLVTLGLGTLTLVALDARQNSKERFFYMWKKRAAVALWVGLGMIAAMIPLPDFNPCRYPPCQNQREAGIFTILNRLEQTADVQTADVQTADIFRSGADRLSNILVSFDLLKRNWWLGAGYEATSWRFRETSWQMHMPKERISEYEDGKIGFYTINIWLQLLVSGGIFALAGGVWLWLKLVLAMYRRMYTKTTASGEIIGPFVWILLAGCMLSADWLLPFNAVFQLVSVAVAVALLYTQNDRGRSTLRMTVVV